MTYKTFDFSSDVGVEAEGASIEEALVELGRAMAHVLTDGSTILPTESRSVELDGARDWPGTAVAWINELVYHFDTDQFLLGAGSLRATTSARGLHRLEGTVHGERFDASRHRAGRGVKAATFHDAEHVETGGRHRFRLVLDL